MNCDVLFFPNKDNEQKVIDFINLAKKELKVCVFTFTNQNIAMAILNKVMKEKVKVRIITDDEQNLSKYSIVDVLQSASDDLIKFRTDLRKDAHMHHKYVVIDDKYLATGSFNWTAAAVNKNNENLLLIRDEKLAKIYSKNFEELWQQFKSTELALSKLAADIKDRGKTLKTKADKIDGTVQKPAANGRGRKNAKQAENSYPQAGEIIEIEDVEDEEEEKVKKSRRKSLGDVPPQQDQQPQELTPSTTPTTPQRRRGGNGRQKKVVDDCGENLQKKENARKQKKIKKVLQQSRILQTKRVILQNRLEETKAQKIKRLLSHAVSFTLGAITVGSSLLLSRFYS